MTSEHEGVRQRPFRVLVRHADAGRRWETGGDEWRGLSDLGRSQAVELVDRMSGLSVIRILSSPSLRCRQTVTPLARTLSLEVEPCHLLTPDVEPTRLVQFLQDPETKDSVLCTHRETLLRTFAWLASTGTRYFEGVAHMEMAAAWTLYGMGTHPSVRYMRHASYSDG